MIVISRTYAFNECGKAGASECPSTEMEDGSVEAIKRADFCRVGYLCNEAEWLGNKVVRWNLNKGVIYVWVPLPDYMTAEEASEARDAAIAGIRQWDGHPFGIKIVEGIGSIPRHRYDMEVVWTKSLRRLGDSHRGVARLEVVQDKDGVDRLANWSIGIATAPTSIYSMSGMTMLQEIEVIAAHEMGHSLGLPHSDSQSDVMWPMVKRGRVSGRDRQTMDALYRFPAGARFQ